MRILYLDGFSNEKERSIYTELVYLNIIKAMKTLVEQADKYEYKIEQSNQVKRKKKFQNFFFYRFKILILQTNNEIRLLQKNSEIYLFK